MECIVKRAMLYAKKHHGLINHLRKYTDEPYINHLASVVKLVESVKHTDEMLAAAWLHDTVEDTNVELINIEEEFGKTISLYVEMLTDISRKSDGNRIIRRNIDLIHLSHAIPEIKTIKLADIIDNAKDIFKNDITFSRIYTVESIRLLSILTEGDSKLYIDAVLTINEAIDKLSNIYDSDWYEKIETKYNNDLYIDISSVTSHVRKIMLKNQK